MKKLCLALLFLLSLPSLAQDTPDLSAAATAFIGQLARGEYEAAAAKPFTEKMREAAPPATLGGIWKAIQTQMGAFKRIVGTRVEPVGGFQSVFVTSEFEGATVDLQVTFDSEGRIAGFFVRPAETGKTEAPPEWTAPAYAEKARFREEEVTVGSGEWALPGTLTIPVGEGPFPALVLVHGSGPHDRDETIGPNKPFKDLAWGLASRGIAVLRYEKRTKAHGLKLLALPGLTAKEEIVDDVVSAAGLLRGRKDVDPKRIFVLGHSLGGTLIPRIGKADPGIAGFIVMAGAARPLEELLLEQVPYIASVDGTVTEAEKKQIEDVRAMVETIRNLKEGSKEAPMGVPASYWLDLQGYHPPAVAKELKQPFLILQGERDYQVTMEDYELWRKALGTRKDVTFKAYPALNHLFMEGKGKATPEEYGRPGHVAAGVVEDVAGWIRSLLAASLWRKHLTPAVADDLHNAFFVDDATGWVIARSSGVVLHTADGGESWTVQAHLGPGLLESITFLNARTGWICGSEGRLFRTRDGGRTWENRSLGTEDVSLLAVRFLDARRGFLAGNDKIRRRGALFETYDGGETWDLREDFPSVGFLADAMAFPTRSAGFVAGNQVILGTRDGGRTWGVALEPGREIVADLRFLDNLTGWAVGHAGLVLRTRDGGSTWERQPWGTRNHLRSVLFIHERTGWIVGNESPETGVLFETVDGGETWTTLELGVEGLHRLVESPGRVWAVGEDGVILSRAKEASAKFERREDVEDHPPGQVPAPG